MLLERSFSPVQATLVEKDERHAVVFVVVAGGIELAVAPAEDLWLPTQELVSCGFAHPEGGVGIDVHRSLLELPLQILIVPYDVERLHNLIGRREGITEVMWSSYALPSTFISMPRCPSVASRMQM